MVDWKNALESYESLKKKLINLEDTSQKETMVPLGSLATVPGHFVDSNKILALLGDDWWAHVNADTAKKIIDHRIKVCQSNLDSHANSEEEEGRRRMKILEQIQENDVGVLNEHLNSEEYEKSEVERKKFLLIQKEKRKTNQEEIRNKRLNEFEDSKSNEQLMERLNALEIEESGGTGSFGPPRIKYKSSPNIYRTSERHELNPHDLYQKFYEIYITKEEAKNKEHSVKRKLRKSVSWKETLVDEKLIEPAMQFSEEEKECYDCERLETESDSRFGSNKAIASHVVSRDTIDCGNKFIDSSNSQLPTKKKESIFKASRKKASQ